MLAAPLPGPLAITTLLERALGGRVALLAFDRQGAIVERHVPAGLPLETTTLTLGAAHRAELCAGVREALTVAGARCSVVAAEDEAGLLWVAVRPVAPELGLPRFAQHLVHALRNSLSSVKLAAQTLSRVEAMPPREKRRVGIAVREIARMERLITTASEYARPPSRPLEEVDLAATLQTAIASTRSELAARNVELCLTLEAPVSRVQGDAQRLQLCFENLLTFGARSMVEGGELEVGLRPEAGAPLLTLRDRGPELSEPERQALFEPLASGMRASGLELALVETVARELGGAVEAENAAPGLRIRLWLGPREGGVHGHAALGG